MLIYSPDEKHNMFVEYINSLLIRETDKCIVWKRGDKINITDEHDLIIFMQVIPNRYNEIVFNNDKKKISIFLCNTEQMSAYSDALIQHIKPFVETIDKNSYNVTFGIIDYSEENLKIIKQTDFVLKNSMKCFYIPYQYKKAEIDFLTSIKTEEKKLCTTGVITDRRSKIIQNMFDKNMIKVDIVQGFGDDRDKKLMRYKILINMGVTDEHNIYEHIRCDRLLFSKMIVISEHRLDEELLDVYDLVVWSSLEELDKKIRDVMRNYDEYKARFSDEKLEKISELRYKMYIDFRNNFN